MKPLYLPLQTEPFRKYERGTKHAELRVLTPRWQRAFDTEELRPGRVVFFRRGHSTEDRLRAVVALVLGGATLNEIPAPWLDALDLGPKPWLIPDDVPVVVFCVRDVRRSSAEEYHAHAAVAAQEATA